MTTIRVTVNNGHMISVTERPAMGIILETKAPCLVHALHAPKTHINEIHHIWPLGDNGPNVAENRVVICATGHNNLHALLDLYRKLKVAENRIPNFMELSRWGKAERDLARLGWERIQRQSL